MTGIRFNSMLANLYRDGKDSVDWHSDNESALGRNPVIASVSLGETRSFELRKNPGPVSDIWIRGTSLTTFSYIHLIPIISMLVAVN